MIVNVTVNKREAGMSKFKKGQEVKIIGVEIPGLMSHLIGKKGVVEEVTNTGGRPYHVYVNGEEGDCWVFSEDELEIIEKDIEYFNQRKKKLDKKASDLRLEFQAFKKEIKRFVVFPLIRVN